MISLQNRISDPHYFGIHYFTAPLMYTADGGINTTAVSVMVNNTADFEYARTQYEIECARILNEYRPEWAHMPSRSELRKLWDSYVRLWEPQD